MIFAAILAGGIGTRMGLNKPKQFHKVGGKEILIHSVEKFMAVDEIDKIIVSSPKDHLKTTEELIKNNFKDSDRITVIEGGKTRNDTILNSIEYVKSEFEYGDHIMITHDAARIFATPDLIRKSIVNVENHDAASPVIPAVDVIFESRENGKLDDIPLRKNLFHAQTPQSFKVNRFIELYETLTQKEIDKLDEAMMLFFLKNGDVKLFDGESENFKITRKIDLTVAESYIENRL